MLVRVKPTPQDVYKRENSVEAIFETRPFTHYMNQFAQSRRVVE